MSDWVLPLTFITLLDELRPVFTKPSYANFRVVVAGWVHALGKRRVSDVVRSAGELASKHYSTYYRFFSHGRWSLDRLGLALLGIIVRVMGVCEVELIVDDTLSRRSGKKVALGMMHADPLLRYKGQPFHSYGHVFVVLAVHVIMPTIAPTGWALPLLFRLFESRKQGNQKDAPSAKLRAASRQRRGSQQRKRQRLTDRVAQGRHVLACEPQPDSGPLPEAARSTKLQLAAEMVLRVAKAFPQVQFRVLADHAYNGNALLQTVTKEAPNVHFILRGYDNAALYELPIATPGQRGRPRMRGQRLPTPAEWAKQPGNDFKTAVVEIYGKRVSVEVASMLGMAYRTLPGRLVRYVIVRDPSGIYGVTYLMSTDTALSAEQIITCYSHRWPLELTFQEAKQKLGMQDPQTQLPRSVRRTAPFALMTYSLVVWWYINHGHTQIASLPTYAMPWYAKNTRPSFTDMMAALRRLGWAEGFFDPAKPITVRSKFMEAYLNKVAAVA
jgi:hypothetical protein